MTSLKAKTTFKKIKRFFVIFSYSWLHKKSIKLFKSKINTKIVFTRIRRRSMCNVKITSKFMQFVVCCYNSQTCKEIIRLFQETYYFCEKILCNWLPLHQLNRPVRPRTRLKDIPMSTQSHVDNPLSLYLPTANTIALIVIKKTESNTSPHKFPHLNHP